MDFFTFCVENEDSVSFILSLLSFSSDLHRNLDIFVSSYILIIILLCLMIEDSHFVIIIVCIVYSNIFTVKGLNVNEINITHYYLSPEMSCDIGGIVLIFFLPLSHVIFPGNPKDVRPFPSFYRFKPQN